MPNTPVPLPILNPQTLFVLACPDCDRFHCFRQLHHHRDDDDHYIGNQRYRGATYVLYNHPSDFGPTSSQSNCPTCPALQEDELAAVHSAFTHTISRPEQEGKLLFLGQDALLQPGNRVLACPQCGETTLFNTDWKGRTTQFWAFGMDRLNRALFDNNHAEWKRLMNGETDCEFCGKLQANEAEAIIEAEAHTEENFPDLNDEPPEM